MKINIRKWISQNFIKIAMKNSATLFTGSFVGSSLGLISFAIIIRVLGSEMYGQFVLVEGYMRVFNQLFNFQCWQALIRFGAESLNKKDISEFKQYIKLGFFFDMISAFIGAVFAVLLVNIVGKYLDFSEDQLFFTKIMSLLIVFNITGTPIGVLRLLKQFKVISYQKVIISIIKLSLVSIGWIIKMGTLHFIYLLIFIQFLDYISLLLFALFYMYKNNYFSFYKEKIVEWKRFVKFALWTNIESTINIPKREFDKFFIAKYLTYQSVSAFSLFKRFNQIITKVTDSIYFAIYPDLSKKIIGGDKKSAIKEGLKIGIILLAASSPLYLLFCGLSYWLLGPIFGYEFEQYYWLLLLYVGYHLLLVLFISIDPIFVSLGYVAKKASISIGSNIIYLLVILLLRGKLDLLGFIIADMAQLIFVIFFKIWIIYRKEYGEIRSKDNRR